METAARPHTPFPDPVPAPTGALTPPAISVRLRRDGTPIELCPLGPDDRDLMAGMFERLSPRSRYFRFMSPMPCLDDRALAWLSNIDGDYHYAWGAFHQGELVGIARFIRSTDDRAAADIALTIVDDFQRRGLGRVLFEALTIVAAERGVERFLLDVLAENRAAIGLLAAYGARFDYSAGSGCGVLPVSAISTESIPHQPRRAA